MDKGDNPNPKISVAENPDWTIIFTHTRSFMMFAVD